MILLTLHTIRLLTKDSVNSGAAHPASRGPFTSVPTGVTSAGIWSMRSPGEALCTLSNRQPEAEAGRKEIEGKIECHLGREPFIAVARATENLC